ncbi:hypothetical protein GCM10009700_21370 [Brevibacterium sanguinis]|jgi:hypothetical protein|uniref:hypothetical protein n=1 Tax=Brevibacterium sanguinis TaxID=232444 RepID=UPI0031E04967
MSVMATESSLSAVAVLAATGTATPSGGPDPDLVTPGTIGFLTTFAIVVVAIFLIRDALKRVRRVRARSRASDAYPIPLRKYAVPNQSKLSGANAPEATGDSSESDQVDADGGTEETRKQDG